MNRRSFFKTILIGTAAIALPIPKLEPLNWYERIGFKAKHVDAVLGDIAIAASKSVSNSELMFASLIAGIKRQTEFMRKHWEIFTFPFDVVAAHKSYALQIDKSVNELTIRDKQQAIMNAVLEKGNDPTST